MLFFNIFFISEQRKKNWIFFCFVGGGGLRYDSSTVFPPGDSQTTCIHFDGLMHLSVFSPEGWRRDYPGELEKGSVSASGTGQIRLESPRPAMPDTKPILTGMAPCPALHFPYQFFGCK